MNPSKAQARRIVLVSVFLLGVLSVYRDHQAGTGSKQGAYRTFWGVGVVGLFLSVAADFVPQLAGPFAGLVVLGSLTNGGWSAIQNVLGLVAAAPGSSSGSPPGPGSSSSRAPSGTGPGTTQGRSQNPAHSTGVIPNPLTGQ